MTEQIGPPWHERKWYFGWLDDQPVLTPKEERRLAEAFCRTRDPELARRLVLGNLRFVVRVAALYQNRQFRLPDLVQEGALGLMVAIRRYDPERGVRLSSYAVWWIRSFIMQHIRKSLRARPQVPGPGFWPRPSLDGEGEDRPTPESLLMERETAAGRAGAVRAALSRLSPREQYIIAARYLSPVPRSREKVGRELGISRERVRQLELRAKAQMQKGLLDHRPRPSGVAQGARRGRPGGSPRPRARRARSPDQEEGSPAPPDAAPPFDATPGAHAPSPFRVERGGLRARAASKRAPITGGSHVRRFRTPARSAISTALTLLSREPRPWNPGETVSKYRLVADLPGPPR